MSQANDKLCPFPGSRRNRGGTQKQLPKLNLGSDDDWRKDDDHDNTSSSDDDRANKTSRKRHNQSIGKSNGEFVKGFNAQEVRRVFRCLTKFPNPLARIDTLAQDAELEEKSQTDLIELVTKVQAISKTAVNEFYEKPGKREKDGSSSKVMKNKGPVFFINGVKLYAKQLSDAEKYFEPLNYYYSEIKEKKYFIICHLIWPSRCLSHSRLEFFKANFFTTYFENFIQVQQ